MIQINNQLTQVGHEFEHKSEQEISVVVSSPNRLATNPANQPEKLADPPIQSPQQVEGDEVTLSPKQQINQKIIEVFARQANGLSQESNQQGLKSLYAEMAEVTEFKMASVNRQNTPATSPAANAISSFTITEHIQEYERLDFYRSMDIKQADGSESQVSLSFTYSRELNIAQQVRFTSAQLQDPLIINLSEQGNLFSQKQQSFDINGDGEKELIPVLNDNVWFLSYDRNNNGIIDNGLELFGGKTGDGFAELDQLDHDNNDLIDANDPAYHHLQLQHSQATNQSLSRAGITAISLDAVDSPFTFKDALGNTLAQMRKTSVYLHNNQQLGAIHQVDFLV